MLELGKLPWKTEGVPIDWTYAPFDLVRRSSSVASRDVLLLAKQGLDLWLRCCLQTW